MACVRRPPVSALVGPVLEFVLKGCVGGLPRAATFAWLSQARFHSATQHMYIGFVQIPFPNPQVNRGLSQRRRLGRSAADPARYLTVEPGQRMFGQSATEPSWPIPIGVADSHAESSCFFFIR